MLLRASFDMIILVLCLFYTRHLAHCHTELHRSSIVLRRASKQNDLCTTSNSKIIARKVMVRRLDVTVIPVSTFPVNHHFLHMTGLRLLGTVDSHRMCQPAFRLVEAVTSRVAQRGESTTESRSPESGQRQVLSSEKDVSCR